MPQFILNTPPAPHEIRRAASAGYTTKASKVSDYYALSDFAKGMVEAMFFTNGDLGDEEKGDNYLNELGVSRLTRAAITKIAADCDAFQRDHAADMEAAKELVPGEPGREYGRDYLDDTRLGHLFWYNRQGHGVSFTDDSCDHADCIKRLDKASRNFGQLEVETWRGWIYCR